MKALLLITASLVSASALASETREFSADVPAGDIKRLELDANVGQVEITAGKNDLIEVRARLEPDDDWFGSSEDLEARLAKAELKQDVSGGVLSLRLDYDARHGNDDDDLEERWEIRVPARLALDTELNVGSMRLEGAGGGIEAEVNVGELDIDVPAGDIDAKVNVGELDVRSATKTPGEFDLESNIGEARLRIDGKAAGNQDGWLGNSVSHDAGGDDDVTARVNVGEVRVDIR